jgi:hypothetical protein
MTHTRTCCVKNNISNMATYQWVGRELDEPSPFSEGDRLVVTKTVVEADMIRRTDEIATQNLTLLPAQVWSVVRAEMEENHPYGWDGLRKDQVCRRVRKARAELGLGDAITTVLNTPLYRMMSDQGRAFLQAFGSYPHPDDPNEFMCMMVYGNPSLIPMLKQRGLDIFVDATFDCTPKPFYQTLILMIFHEETESYVPVLYALMTHKNANLYCAVFSSFIVCSGWKMKVRTFTSDFEIALFTEMDEQFGLRFEGAEGGGCTWAACSTSSKRG